MLHLVFQEGLSQRGVVVPPGAEWISDPVAFQVDPLSKLAVSLYFQGVTPVTTTHWEGRDTAYITDGNTVGDPTIKPSFIGPLAVGGAVLSAISVVAFVIAYGAQASDFVSHGSQTYPEANALLSRNYREGFVVPVQV